MLSTLLYQWETKRVIRNFLKDEKEQLSALRSVYSHHITEPIENTPFDTDENGIPKNKTTFFITKTIEKFNYDSPLSPYINGIIATIMQYLSDRDTRLLNKGYSNDPTNLFCLLLLRWFQNTLQKIINEQLLEEIRRWKKFLEAVRAEKIFPKDEAKQVTQTMDALLLNLIDNTEKIINCIKFEISRITIGRHLESVVNFGKNALTFSFDYLLLVISDLSIPLNSSIMNFHDAIVHKQLKTILATSLGRCLQTLAFSPAVRELFHPQHFEQIVTNPQSMAMIQYSETELLSLTYLEETGKLKKNTHLSFISNKSDKTGISHLFRDDTALIESFIGVMSKLEILAKILLNYREAAYLTNSGGEILMCTLTRAQLLFLIESFRQLKTEITEILKFIAGKAKDCFNQQYEKSKDSMEKWKDNYTTATTIYESIDIAFTSAINQVGPVFTTLSNVDVKIEKIRNRLEMFANNIVVLANDYTWLVPDDKIRKALIATTVQPLISLANSQLQKENSEQPALSQKDQISYLPQKTAKKLYGNFNGVETILTFKTEPDEEDPDSGFKVLGVERLVIIKKLIGCKDEKIIKLIHPELESAFLQTPLLKIMQANINNYNKLQEKVVTMNNVIINLVNHALGYDNLIPPEIKKQNTTQIFVWLKNGSALQKECQIAEKKYQEAQAELTNLLLKISPQYLKEYYIDNKGALKCLAEVTTTLTAIVTIIKKNVYIWQATNHSLAEMVHQHVTNTEKPDDLHLLYIPSVTAQVGNFVTLTLKKASIASHLAQNSAIFVSPSPSASANSNSKEEETNNNEVENQLKQVNEALKAPGELELEFLHVRGTLLFLLKRYEQALQDFNVVITKLSGNKHEERETKLWKSCLTYKVKTYMALGKTSYMAASQCIEENKQGFTEKK